MSALRGSFAEARRDAPIAQEILPREFDRETIAIGVCRMDERILGDEKRISLADDRAKVFRTPKCAGPVLLQPVSKLDLGRRPTTNDLHMIGVAVAQRRRSVAGEPQRRDLVLEIRISGPGMRELDRRPAVGSRAKPDADVEARRLLSPRATAIS